MAKGFPGEVDNLMLLKLGPFLSNLSSQTIHEAWICLQDTGMIWHGHADTTNLGKHRTRYNSGMETNN